MIELPGRRIPNPIEQFKLLLNSHDGAFLNPRRTHRYALWRKTGRPGRKPKGSVLFIGLNPSRASERENDNTISRCIHFASQWDYERMFFGNLFSRMSTDPDVIANDQQQAVHPVNDDILVQMANESEIIICCWGSWKFIDHREREVLLRLDSANNPLFCFGQTKTGHPRHPSRLGYNTKLEVYKQ